MKKSVKRWLWGFSVLLLVSLLPFSSCQGAEPRYTMTAGEMGQFMNLLEKQRAWQKKQKEESLELEKELRNSARDLEKAESESRRAVRRAGNLAGAAEEGERSLADCENLLRSIQERGRTDEKET